MFVISHIQTARRRPGRFEIIVEDKVFATLSLDVIERLHLAVGRSVAGQAQLIADEAAQLAVYDRAVAMLAFRARASAELARALVRKGEDKRIVQHAILRLEEQGLLDDLAFARAFTRSKVLGAQHSRRRVQQELASKGVKREISDVAIASVFAEEEVDQRAVVEAAARRKLRSLVKVAPLVRRRRLYAFLARRGYDGDDIRRAMAAVRSGATEGEDPR